MTRPEAWAANLILCHGKSFRRSNLVMYLRYPGLFNADNSRSEAAPD